MNKDRRKIVGGIVAGMIASELIPRHAIAQLSSFNIRILRENVPYTGVIEPGRCVYGKLWFSNGSMPDGIGESPIKTLELPDRNNMDSISFIPEGEYSAFVRQDDPRGWRIELENVPSRGNIQIHIGNFPEQILGCILVGTHIDNSVETKVKVRNNQNGMEHAVVHTCAVVNSGRAMDSIRDAYADDSNNRRIVVSIS